MIYSVSRWSVSVVLECSLVPEEGSYISLSPFADQIGLTPEEVISKIMANPEVAMAFQNPRVQAAIMDVCPLWFTDDSLNISRDVMHMY